jgi:small subunit ribosomal protein S7
MRGKKSTKRTIAPDPRFQSNEIAKFINYIMERGKKTTAQKIVYGALDDLSARTKSDPMEIMEQAMVNIRPTVEVRSRRVGGSNYQVPVPVSPERKIALAYRWLIAAARKRKGKPMAIKLADELLAASKEEGEAVKKRQDVQRMAESNKAFAHFA